MAEGNQKGMISVIFCTSERTMLDCRHQIGRSKGYCWRIASEKPLSRLNSWLATIVMQARLAQVPAIIAQQ